MILSMIIIVLLGIGLVKVQESKLWEQPFSKFLRWLIFIPLSLIILAFIFSIPHIIFNMIYEYAWWQIILVLAFLVGILTVFFQATINYGTILVLNMCPHAQTGSAVTILLSLILCCFYIFSVWTTGKYDAINFRGYFHSLGVTLTIIPLLVFIVLTSVKWFKGDYNSI